MAKKKLRFKVIKFILFLMFIGLLLCIYFFLIGDNISNIKVKNNYLLTEQEILELANLDDYPSFLLASKSEIIKKLKTNEFISDVKVTKKIGRIIILNVTENKVLFRNGNNSKYVLSNAKEYNFDLEYDVPILINYVPDEIYKSLIKEMSKVENVIIQKVSEIKYAPNDYDDDLFILYMNDQNVVHVTLDKLEKLNKYNDIVTKLEGDKGILYLDSGNYFKIMN